MEEELTKKNLPTKIGGIEIIVQVSFNKNITSEEIKVLNKVAKKAGAELEITGGGGLVDRAHFTLEDPGKLHKLLKKLGW